MRAFSRAMQSTLQVNVDGCSIEPDGKTDPLILKEFLESSCGLASWSASVQEALFEAYLICLQEEMAEAKRRSLIRVLPGVVAILEDLTRRSDYCLGLVTGNLEKGARIKLENAELMHYFRFGGYGSDAEDRTQLTRMAMQRGAQIVAPAMVSKSFIIGDTPLDIMHGRAAGASVIAVASARYSVPELKKHNPDLLVPDLTYAPEILDFMQSQA